VQDLAASFDHITCEIGRVPEVRREELLNFCDVLLLPYSSFSSQSGVLADAYAHGKPMIVTDVGALGPTVRADETGFVVPPSDVESLASAITELAKDPATRARFGENAQAAARLHTYEAVGTELRGVFQEAAKSSS
jgi:glycosyltransferase involved in cell wall biosynthesis